MVIERVDKGYSGKDGCVLKVRYGSEEAKVALQQYMEKRQNQTDISLNKSEIHNLFIECFFSSMPRQKVLPVCNWLFRIALADGFIFEKSTGEVKKYGINPVILDSGSKTEK